MAEAKVIGARVNVQLTLSEEETAVLYTILMNVGGDVAGSRSVSQSVLRSLDDIAADNPAISKLCDEYEEKLVGELTFK